MPHRLEYALNLGRFLLRTAFRVLFYWPGLVLATLALLFRAGDVCYPQQSGAKEKDKGVCDE